MHESAIAQAILDTVVNNTPPKTKKITKINIVANELSAIVIGSLELYFNEASRGTVAEGASLNLKNASVPKDYVESIEVESED